MPTIDFDPQALVQSYTKNNPGWWTPKNGGAINVHSGVTVEHRNRQQKWHKQKEGSRGWALIDGKMVDVFVCGKHRDGDNHMICVMPVDGEVRKVWVDIDQFSRRKGMIKRNTKGE